MRGLAKMIRKNGKTYATCRECGDNWNVSKYQFIPFNGYVCPKCRGKQRREEAKGTTKTMLITLAGIVLYFVAAEAAKIQRGYTAYGGECLLLFLPLWWYLIKEAIKSIKGMVEVANE